MFLTKLWIYEKGSDKTV